MPHVADDRKLRELMLYIASRSMDDPFMGAMKLNRVLFRCDYAPGTDSPVLKPGCGAPTSPA